MSSILTNSSALVALQTLSSISKNLDKTQDMISTGLEMPPSRSLAALEVTLEMLFPEEPELFNPPKAG